MHTLSIVAPNGSNIAMGRKTLEIRKWRPQGPVRNLLIVENAHFLTNDLPEEPGIAVCSVDIIGYHDWLEHEIRAACASYWEPEWIAWEISNVRPIHKFPAMAKKRIYTTTTIS